MTKPLEKQTIAQLRKAATKKKNRVCGTPSKMKKGELISFLKEGKPMGPVTSVMSSINETPDGTFCIPITSSY